MRPGRLLLLCLTLSACRPTAGPPPDPAFRRLQRVTVSETESLPDGELRLTAFVLNAGRTNDGTFLDLADPSDHSQRTLLVYGRPVDAVFAEALKGHEVELVFKAAGRTTLSDGRKAVRINLTGMRDFTPASGAASP
jgi:hypothetical protein